MNDTDSSDSSISSFSRMAAAASSLSAKPKPFSQSQLNDLGLYKESSNILASRLREHGILDSGTKITLHSNRDDLLIHFFTMKYYFKASFQKWIFQSTTQINGNCLWTAPNGV